MGADDGPGLEAPRPFVACPDSKRVLRVPVEAHAVADAPGADHRQERATLVVRP